MFFIPFPILLIEIIVFVFAAERIGFLNTLGIYFAPSLLGILIMSVVGRLSLMQLQNTMMSGKEPGTRLLHSGAIFLSGLLFLIPSLFSRVIGVFLLLPGFRHLLIWKFKNYFVGRMARGASFGFGGPGGASGFRYYEFRQGQQGFGQNHEEREVHEANVLDVTPLEITHENKNENKEEDPK